MSKKITTDDLNELQYQFIKNLSTRVRLDNEDSLPTDAATLGVIAKVLKDNDISVDPADQDTLQDLRTELQRQAQARRERTLQVAYGDLSETLN